jgi:DNA-binding NarL/FixJ family response regulator
MTALSSALVLVKSTPSKSRKTPIVGNRQPILLISKKALMLEALAQALQLAARAPVVTADTATLDLRFDPDDRPRIVLLDISSARVTDTWVAGQIEAVRQLLSGAPLVAIGERDDTEVVIEALRHGLNGYIPTSLNLNLAAAAICLILAGGTFIPPCVLHGYAERVSNDERKGLEENALMYLGFTWRETEVLSHLQQGKANKTIAYELNMALSTVKVHVRNIMKKLSATNRTQVVASLNSGTGARRTDG